MPFSYFSISSEFTALACTLTCSRSLIKLPGIPNSWKLSELPLFSNTQNFSGIEDGFYAVKMQRSHPAGHGNPLASRTLIILTVYSETGFNPSGPPISLCLASNLIGFLLHSTKYPDTHQEPGWPLQAGCIFFVLFRSILSIS